MTKDQINQAIAELCGWTDGGGKANWPDFGYGPTSKPYPAEPEPPPDYHGSLDRCAEMEATLTEEEHNQFRQELQIITNPKPEAYLDSFFDFRSFASATAPQRCQAFLRVKGKWQ